MIHRWCLPVLLSAFMIAGCASLTPQVTPMPLPTSTPTLTPTPDVCSRENLLPVVTGAHSLMREFDDINQVASLTPQSQLGDMVLKLEDVRRRAEDFVVPACIQAFRALEVDYMNSVIAYYKLFMAGGYTDNLSNAIAASQQKRIAYDNARMFLLGITPTPSPSLTNAPGTLPPPTPSVTPTAVVISGDITVSNPSMLGRNLHTAPSLDSRVVALLLPGDSAPATARDGSDLWVLVEYHDQQLWVYASQVSISAPLDSLPMIQATETPTPES